MQENIDQLLSILESHVTQKRYASTIDLMWFLCRLFEDSAIEASTDAVSRLCQIATHVLPMIDNHVQEEDIRLEFRNHLNELGRGIFILGQKKHVDEPISNNLKKLLDLNLQTKPTRSVLWDNFSQLDWQSTDTTNFKKWEEKRLQLRHQLNQEIHLFSSNLSEKNQRTLYLKSVQCIGRMVLPWFSSLIYQRHTPSTKKVDVVSLLDPIEPLINSVLPFLPGDDQALGWELIHLYGYWVRDRSVLPTSPEGLQVFIQSAMSTSSQTLVALSYGARLVTTNGYRNNKATLSMLCQQVLQLEKGLIQTIPTPTHLPTLFNDHRDSLKKIRGLWQTPIKKSTLVPTLPRPSATSVKSLLPHKLIAQKQQAFSKGSVDLMRTLLAECVSVLGEPSGKLALLLLGSSSRNDRLPYSDIECALIYEATPEQSIPMRGYLYALLSLLEFAIIRLGETQNFNRGGDAGFHLDSSDHILSLQKKLIGTVEELHHWHVESTILQSPGDLVLTGNLGKEGKGQLLYAMLTPCLVNADWGGESLFLAYQNKVQLLLNTPIDAWTQQAFKLAYFENKLTEDQQHVLPKNPTVNISQKRSSEQESLLDTQDDFNASQDSVAPLTIRQTMALYCWVDVLRKAEKTLLEAKQATKNPLLNVKDVYHKPLVYLALNLQLFLGASEKHPIHMFEVAFAASILPFGVKVLLQQMLSHVIQLRSELHFNKKTQEEEITLNALSPENQITLEMIERVLLRPLKIAIEALLGKKEKTNDIISSSTWSMALREAFNKVWMHYSKERMGWQARLLTHPLIVCLADHPSPDGTKPSIDLWLAQKKTQQQRLLLQLDDAIFQEKTYRKHRCILIEQTQDRQKTISRLHPAGVQQLIDKNYLTFKGELQFSEEQIAQEKGRHLVMAVTIPALNENSAFTVYLKVYPEMPALECAVTELSLLLVGPFLPWVELVRMTVGGKSYPVLLSQGIEGTNLSDALQSTQPVPLVPTAFSQRVLLSLLLNQEDAKPSNFIAHSVKDSSNQISLVSIDNDRSFYPGLELDSDKQQWVPVVKDITFCFDAMHHPIDLSVREAFLALDPYSLLSFWLMLGQRLSHDLKVLFSDKEVIQCFPKSGLSRSLSNFGRLLAGVVVPEESVLSLMLRKGIVENLYTKLKRLQSLLLRKPGATHLDLLREVEPYLARYYEKLLPLAISPYKRFYRGFGALYDKTNTLEKISETSRKELPTQTTIFRTFETQQGKPVSLDELLKSEIRHLKDSLEELEATHKAQVQWRSILANLQSNQKAFENILVVFKALPNDLQELIINYLDFSKVGGPSLAKQQNKLLEVLISSKPNYQNLCLRNCTALTDKLLEKLLSHSPPLESLSLVSCVNITEKSMSLIGQYAPNLKRLVLQNLSWKTIGIKIDARSRFFWFKPMGFTQENDWHALNILVVRECKNLSVSVNDILDFNLSQLTHLEMTVRENQHQILQALTKIHLKFPLLKNVKLLPRYNSNKYDYDYLFKILVFTCTKEINQYFFKFFSSSYSFDLTAQDFYVDNIRIGNKTFKFQFWNDKRFIKESSRSSWLDDEYAYRGNHATIICCDTGFIAGADEILGAINDFSIGSIPKCIIDYDECSNDLKDFAEQRNLLYMKQVFSKEELLIETAKNIFETLGEEKYEIDLFRRECEKAKAMVKPKKLSRTVNKHTDTYDYVFTVGISGFEEGIKQLLGCIFPSKTSLSWSRRDLIAVTIKIRDKNIKLQFGGLHNRDSFIVDEEYPLSYDTLLVCSNFDSHLDCTERYFQEGERCAQESAKRFLIDYSTINSSEAKYFAEQLDIFYIKWGFSKEELMLEIGKNILKYLENFDENEISVFKENIKGHENIVLLPCKAVSGSENNMLQTSSPSATQLGFSGLSPCQPAIFKRLFFTPPEQNMKHQARIHLFRFFSDRDRQSFSCVSKSCYSAQKEIDAELSKNISR